MKVLLVHNRYRSTAPSGEDVVVDNERRMLLKFGVEVVTFEKTNDDIDDSSGTKKLAAAANSIWSRRARAQMEALLDAQDPDVVHVHNTFAAMSPSIYGACRQRRVPVVQTLHNFRLFCPAGLFLRDGRPCEACVDRSLLQSVRYRCYRNSLAATSTVAGMLAVHRALGTLPRCVDRYVALTGFARERCIRAGIPGSRIVVKPNFLPDPPREGAGDGGYVLFVGRMLDGKGLETLLAAWRELPHLKLKLIGDGARRQSLEDACRAQGSNIEFLGMQPRAVVLEAMSRAAALIVPSEWYEGFPMVVAESYACGTPVLASRIGSLDEIVFEGVTGLKFAPGNPAELARVVGAACADPGRLQALRPGTRKHFDEHLSETRNFESLMSLYADVTDGSGASMALRAVNGVSR